MRKFALFKESGEFYIYKYKIKLNREFIVATYIVIILSLTLSHFLNIYFTKNVKYILTKLYISYIIFSITSKKIQEGAQGYEADKSKNAKALARAIKGG